MALKSGRHQILTVKRISEIVYFKITSALLLCEVLNNKTVFSLWGLHAEWLVLLNLMSFVVDFFSLGPRYDTQSVQFYGQKEFKSV